jgi:hypothetical protein
MRQRRKGVVRRWAGIVLLALGVLSGPAKAADLARPLFQPLLTPATGLLCRQAVAQAEQSYRLPPHLLEAIALVESGRKDPLTGAVEPWPWTLDAAGEGHFYASKAEAIAAAQDFQAKGVKLIDVGCLQINLYHHPHAFASLEQAFDPMANAAYAAQFLSQLHAELGSWEEAAAHYHSTTPELAADYKRKVLVAWTAAQNAQPLDTLLNWGTPPVTAALSRPVGGVHGVLFRPLHPPPALLAAATPPAASLGHPVVGENSPHPGFFSRDGRVPPPPSPARGRDLAAYRAHPVFAPVFPRLQSAHP